MKSKPGTVAPERQHLNGTMHSETKTLTGLMRCLLVSVSMQALAAFVFLGGLTFAVVWIEAHVQRESAQIGEIVSNAVLITDEVHSATGVGKQAVVAASIALNKTANVLQTLAEILGSPTISLQLGNPATNGRLG
jgi:hypothetical protein